LVVNRIVHLPIPSENVIRRGKDFRIFSANHGARSRR
jgi:hypothetical protein